MPTPEKGESEKDFVDRCMAFPDMQKHDPDQRAAICHSMYREHQKGSSDARGWYRFTNQVADGDLEAELYVYDVIGDWGFGESVSARQFVSDLAALPQSVRRITLHVNSPGGSVFDAVAIANSLRAHKADVEVKIEGLAASAATIVAMAGKQIQIAENAMMMIHDPYAIAVGGAKDMRAQADALDRVRDSIVATYRWHSELSPDQISTMMEDVTWMSADEAVANGFATKVGPAANATGHLDAATLAKIGPVPERFAALLTADVEVPRETIVSTQGHTAISPQKGAAPKTRRKKMPENEQIETANAKAVEDAKAAGVAEGAQAERERILGIDAIAMSGHEQLVAEAKSTGMSIADFAIAQANAEKSTRQKRLEAIKKDGLAAAPSANATTTGEIKPVADDPSRSLEERAKAEWDRNAANDEGVRIQDEFTSFEAFLALKQNEPRIRILRVVNR